MNTHAANSRRGFVLAEVAAIVAILTLALCVLAVAATRGRANVRASESLSNLRQIGSLVMQYANDNAGLAPAYSWQSGVTYASAYPELRRGFSNTDAASRQAVDIIRRNGDVSFALPANWFPFASNSHLVLADYAGLALRDRLFYSPGDEVRLGWRSDPSTAPEPRLSYQSSYEFSPALYYSGETADGGSLRNVESNLWSIISTQSNRLEPKQLSLMRAPSQKALVFERFQWFFGERKLFFMFRDARVPVLMGDGGAAIRRSGDASAGAYTLSNGRAAQALVTYQPASYEPPAYSPDTLIDCRLRFTHQLLRGTDFGPPLP